MFENFTTFDILTQSSPPVTIHGIKSPPTTTPLPPLLLLHGAPQSHHIWHLITPSLLTSYTLIAIDIRGYGQSSKPPSEKGFQYAKSLMAQDCHKVMTTLGYPSYYICAHDRGARVAHKLLIDQPGAVKKAILLDICPTLSTYAQTDFAFAKAYWHWFLLIQPSPLPELMFSAEPRRLLGLFMGGIADIGVFDREVLEVYAGFMEDAENVHGMCEDYRAAATVDLEESRGDIEKGRRIKCPVRVLWGRFGVVEMKFDAVKEWKDVSDGEVTGESIECGHFIPEEKPDEVVRHIKEFLRD